MYHFQPLKMLWVVVQNYPHMNLKWKPVTLSTSEDSRILKSHGLRLSLEHALNLDIRLHTKATALYNLMLRNLSM